MFWQYLWVVNSFRSAVVSNLEGSMVGTGWYFFIYSLQCYQICKISGEGNGLVFNVVCGIWPCPQLRCYHNLSVRTGMHAWAPCYRLAYISTMWFCLQLLLELGYMHGAPGHPLVYNSAIWCCLHLFILTGIHGHPLAYNSAVILFAVTYWDEEWIWKLISGRIGNVRGLSHFSPA